MQKKNGVRPKIINELMAFFENVIAPYLDGRFDKVDSRLDKVDTRLDKVENELQEVKTELQYVKSDVRDLKADMPTKQDFEVVKKLEKIHQKELTAFPC